MEQAGKRGQSALSAICAAGHTCPVMVSHGNLIANLLAGIDGRFGFDDRARMAKPDAFILTCEGGTLAGWARSAMVG